MPHDDEVLVQVYFLMSDSALTHFETYSSQNICPASALSYISAISNDVSLEIVFS